MKKLLYISTRIFWPPMGGHEMEMYHYCRGLYEKYGYTIDIYVFDSKNDNVEKDKPSFINTIFYAKQINITNKIANIVLKSFLHKWPLQNSLYYSNENKIKINNISKRNNYDVIIVDMIRLASYYDAIKEINCKKILDIDDTLSKRYIRQLKGMNKKTDISGQYKEKLPTIINKIISSQFIKKIILRIEIPRMIWAEEYYSRIYDNVIFVSEIETREFKKKYKNNKAVTVSLGVDYPYYSENLNIEKVPGRVAFVGNMATPANADSVRDIIDNILPKCKKVKEIYFIGNCPKELIDEYKDKKGIVFTGKVDDLRPFVESATVFLAPIAYGTGIKTKILEAMAMGMIVVTNSIGAEGIAAKNGIHWFVNDDAFNIAKVVDEQVNNISTNEIGERAKKYVEDNYQWDIIFEQFKKLNL